MVLNRVERLVVTRSLTTRVRSGGEVEPRSSIACPRLIERTARAGAGERRGVESSRISVPVMPPMAIFGSCTWVGAVPAAAFAAEIVTDGRKSADGQGAICELTRKWATIVATAPEFTETSYDADNREW
jgi:hypothetical protein